MNARLLKISFMLALPLIGGLSLESASAQTQKAAMGTAASAVGVGACSDQDLRCQLLANAVDTVNETACLIDVSGSNATQNDGVEFIYNMGSASEYNISEVDYHEDVSNPESNEPGAATKELRRLSNDASASLGTFKKGADFTYYSKWDHDGFYEQGEPRLYDFTMHLFVAFEENSGTTQVLYCKLKVSKSSGQSAGSNPSLQAAGDERTNYVDSLQNSSQRTPTPTGPGQRQSSTSLGGPPNPRDVAGEKVRNWLHTDYSEEDQGTVRDAMQNPAGWLLNQAVDALDGKEEDRRSPIERRDDKYEE